MKLMKNNSKKKQITYFDRFRGILNIQLPVTLELGLSYFMQSINIAFIGHKDDTSMLAGITIGSLYSHLTSMSLIIGFN